MCLIVGTMGNIESKRFVWFYGILAVTGCAGRLENEERFVSCEPGYVERLFETQCASCHGGATPQGALDLMSSKAAARMLEIPADIEGPCNGRTLISLEGDHLLIDKLQNTSCGSRMPLGGAPLSGGDLECVRQWIDSAIAEAP